MALINQNSIIGVTSITSPSASNVLTFHTNDTTERLRVTASGVSFSGTNASLDTSGNLTVGGNVNVAGVLTYEDVTSVDAVGLSTFQNGIHVTGGSVGINETSPVRKLHVKADNAPVARFERDTSDGEILEIRDFNNNQIGGFGSDTGDLTLSAYNSNNLRIETGGSEKVRISSSGNVGIGSQSPGVKLDVQMPGSSSRQNLARFRHEGQTDLVIQGQWGALDIGSANGTLLYNSSQTLALRSGSSGNAHVVLRNGGYVGIGTDNPGERLDVDGSIRLRAAGNYTTYATKLYSRLDSTHCTVLESYLNSSTPFELIGSYADSGGANPRVVLAAGGQRVGIGTDNPDQKLEVNGAIKVTNGSSTEGAQMLVLPLPDVTLAGNASASLNLGNRFTGMVVVSGYTNDTASGVWVVASASAYDVDTVSRLLFRTHPASNTTDLTITTTSVGDTHQFQLNQSVSTYTTKTYKAIAFGIYG